MVTDQVEAPGGAGAMPSMPGAAPPGEPRSAEISCSRGLAQWLLTHQVSLAISSYQTGRLYLIGVLEDGRVNFHETGVGRAMGLWADPQRLLLATDFQLWRFENVLAPGETAGPFDRHYVPRVSHVTGDLDIHDIGVRADGVIVFANTLFSCLAHLSNVHAFKPVWAPPFISRLAPEDRCHLNGLAMRDGLPAYVTATSRADIVDGWRDRRDEGGCVIDVASDAIVSSELSMPHSPRWHDGRLWLLNSGTGELGTLDLKSGQFDPVVFLPGFARGLAFHRGHAIVGLSLPRRGTFAGLALDAGLRRRDAEPWCGVHVVDLARGDVVEWIRFDSVVTELLDVCVIPGVRSPYATAPQAAEVGKVFTIEPPS